MQAIYRNKKESHGIILAYSGVPLKTFQKSQSTQPRIPVTMRHRLKFLLIHFILKNNTALRKNNILSGDKKHHRKTDELKT